VPFILLNPVIAPPGFLFNAAGVANQVRAAILLLFAGSAIAIGISSTGWSVFRQYNSAMALWLLALAVASFSLQAVDNAHILSMLSLSQQYVTAGGKRADLFRAVVGSSCSAVCCTAFGLFPERWQCSDWWGACFKLPGSR
jgi:hypothetical protein